MMYMMTKHTIYQLMSIGFCLGVKQEISPSERVPMYIMFHHQSKSCIPVYSIAEPIQDIFKYLHKLTEEGEPPLSERNRLTGWRVGWKEMGLIRGYDWYVHAQ